MLETENSEPAISRLKDDCIIAILQKLPLPERLRAERVCRKWQELMPYSDIRVIKLDDFHWKDSNGTCLEIHDQNLTITQEVLKIFWLRGFLCQVLTRCGYTLEDISFRIQKFRIVMTYEIVQLLSQNAPKLKRLNLYNSIIYSKCVPLFRDFINLRYLMLASSEFLSEDLQIIRDYSELERDFTEFVSKALMLEQLNIANFKFAPELKSRSLKRLNAMSLPLDDISMDRLCRNVPNLQFLNLNSCTRIRSFSPIWMNLQNLQCLWLSYCKIQDSDLENISKFCPALQQLRVDGCNLISKFECLKNLSNLQLLWVGPNRQFTDLHLGKIARHGKLTNISLTGTQITDQGVRFLARFCHKTLKELSVSHTMIGERAFQALSEQCRSLEFLQAQFTGINNTCMRAIGGHNRNLKHLYVQSCPEISESGFRMLLLERRNLQFQSLPLLKIISGGELAQPLSNKIVAELRSVNVELIVQRPLLALPSTHE